MDVVWQKLVVCNLKTSNENSLSMLRLCRLNMVHSIYNLLHICTLYQVWSVIFWTCRPCYYGITEWCISGITEPHSRNTTPPSAVGYNPRLSPFATEPRITITWPSTTFYSHPTTICVWTAMKNKRIPLTSWFHQPPTNCNLGFQIQPPPINSSTATSNSLHTP